MLEWERKADTPTKRPLLSLKWDTRFFLPSWLKAEAHFFSLHLFFLSSSLLKFCYFPSFILNKSADSFFSFLIFLVLVFWTQSHNMLPRLASNPQPSSHRLLSAGTESLHHNAQSSYHSQASEYTMFSRGRRKIFNTELAHHGSSQVTELHFQSYNFTKCKRAV